MENSRRNFIKKSTLGVAAMTIGGVGMSAKSYRKVIGANSRLNIAIVGLGRRLHQEGVVEPIAMKENNVNLKYFCDVMKNQRIRAAEKYSKMPGYTPVLENDIRRIFDDKEVDIVVNQAPDHWHTPGACYAVQAGKHVYLEKPTSHNPREGEILAQFQKKYGKLIQTGNQGSLAPKITEIIKEIHNGIIGEAYQAVAFYSNRRGKVPVPQKAAVPEGLDWELWQGPAPRQEYKHDTWDYNWHWYGWTMYDTLDVTLVFPGNKIVKLDSKSRNRHLTYGAGTGTVVYGTKGAVFMSGTGYKLFDREGKLLREDDSDADSSVLHYVNFFDSIRGKEKLHAPVDEVEKTTLWCHLANISYRIGKGFDINRENGQALDRDALKFWGREYAPGWEPKL